MLKREITYEDFDGKTTTETFYFNLTKTEIVGLEVGHEGGLEAAVRRIVQTNDNKSLLREFQNIILAAYGIRSEDGKRFIKSDELRLEFEQTAAFDALFMELMTDEGKAAVFIRGVLPADLASEIAKSQPGMLEVPLNLPPPEPPAA